MSFRLPRPVLTGSAPSHRTQQMSPVRSSSSLPAKDVMSAWCSTAVPHDCLLQLEGACLRAVATPMPSCATVCLATHLLHLSPMSRLRHLQGSSSPSSATPAHSCAPASLSTSTCRAPTPCSTTSQSTTSSWGWARVWQSVSGGAHCGDGGLHVTVGGAPWPCHCWRQGPLHC